MTRPRPSEDDRPVIVLGPNPTPNGGMHLGHIAGPYLAGDVYARYERARGREVIFSTGTDDSQTFVVATAARQGVRPEDLCVTSTMRIKQALAAMGISVDGFGPFDDGYRATVLDYFKRLHAAGKFKLRTVKLPYLERTGEFIVEGLVEGYCPVCLALSRGGLCETCCHPNNFDQLIEPHYTINAGEVDPVDAPIPREADILVLPMEEYRDRLTAYHEAWAPYWRPHMVRMVRDVLSRPLLDLPITYPLEWGIRAPFPETPGQVLNAWLELIPAGIYTTSYCAAQLGQLQRWREPGQLWLPEANRRLVHFLGFDNAYFFCLAHMALMMAHGDKYILPESVLTNEFYELESEKFSTSKGHVLAPEDLLPEVPRDLVRFYLALTAPSYQRTTFSRDGLDKVTAGQLVEPWNKMVSILAKAIANAGADGPLPTSASGRRHVAAMLERFDFCYEMPNYNLNQVAETILVHVGRLARVAADRAIRGIDEQPEAWGDLFLQVKVLLAVVSPVLIDLAVAARQSLGFDGALTSGAYDVTSVQRFVPPLLPRTGTFTADGAAAAGGPGQFGAAAG
jgi:methionyl-tRNA synthetase